MVEHALRDVLDRLGIAWASYEYTLVEGRPDALYGRVVIEYEKPGVLGSEAGFKHAVDQAVGYIKELAPSVDLYPKYFGIVLDGYQIGFVRFRRAWDIQGPFAVNKQTVLKLLEAIRGLRRRPLKADLLNKDLGPESLVAKVVVGAFYRKLKSGMTPRVDMLFEDWKRVFSQVCGYSPEKIKGLEEVYGLKKDQIDYEALLFSVHTYFGLVMKLLAAEVAVSLGGSYLQSYIKKLEDAYLKGSEKLKETLKDLEEGEIFSRIGIRNFLEADYFAWYLDLWDEVLAEAVNKVARALSEYEPATAELEPDEVKDMLKRLYQYLVPKKIRHDLGEYYTPDWLAELVLNEVGYDGNVDKRLLDPACGSGTFLVLAIKRAKQNALNGFINESDALEKILKNIVGFDLNPLAVIAARTNYLIVLGELIRYRKRDIEIPVYLADSILVERRTTLTGPAYVSNTFAGEFTVPVTIVEKGTLAGTLTIIEECVRGGYTKDELKARLLKEVNIDENEASVLAELYTLSLRLEKEGKNRIWLRLLKNSFAPLFTGEFDYVVGNPPWINWSDLPNEYRNKTKVLWGKYGLLGKIKSARLGAAERDMAMLFTCTSIDKYLRKGGNFGFLITQSVFKSMAGEGFRKFVIPTKEGPTRFRVIRVHDFVELLPFEGAQNRTAMIIAIKNGETAYPVAYTLWRGSTVDQKMSLEDVMKETVRIELEAIPMRRNTGPWSTLKPKAHQAIKKTVGVADYKAHLGVHLGLNSAYWVRILDALPDGSLLVTNVIEGAKRKVRKIEAPIERALLYPHLRGRDVNKWCGKPSLYAVLPVDDKGKTISMSKLRINYPKTYSFFNTFFDELVTRTTEPYKSQLRPWRDKSKEIAEKIAPPFYTLFNVAPSFSTYKVVWRRVATGLVAAVVGSVLDNFLGSKVVTPNEKLVLVSCERENEAHYVCALLNSSIARLVAKSYVIEIQISAHIVEYVRIPAFDPRNDVHLKLAALSMQAHEYTDKGDEQSIKMIEDEIDRLAAQLYGLTDEELLEVKNSLKIFESKAEEIGKETEEEQIVEEAKPEAGPAKRALESLIKKFKEERS
jgi:methylase of polypeptide subunit release factors